MFRIIRKYTFPTTAIKYMAVGIAILMVNTVSSQCVITIDGAVNIDVPSGTFFGVTGDVVLQDASSSGSVSAFDNKGTVHITGNFTNNAAANSGFVTSGATPPTTGTCILEGGNQNIAGSRVTTFFNLTLSGTGTKTLTATTATVRGTLALADREFATGANILIVDVGGSITRTTGYVSSTAGGFLQRNCNSTAMLSFPVSNPGGTRFRALEITPANTTSNQYRVRLVNNSPTADGFSASSTDANLCNPLSVTFYWRVQQTAAQSATMTMYFASATDGVHTKMAHWEGAPVWTDMAASAPTTGTFYGTLTDQISKSGWSNFSPNEPFALANPITPAIPTANAATLINCNTFTANWTAVANVVGYYLDVSTASDFSSFVTGYNGLNVGNVTSYAVTGLSTGTNYYYRLRAWNGCGTSGNSNVIGPVATFTATVAPTTLTTSATPVCAGTTVTLTQSGGTLGTGATWEWHSNSSYTALVGTSVAANASLNVTPPTGATTTYWLRATSGGSSCTPVTNGPTGGVAVQVYTNITGTTFIFTNSSTCGTSNATVNFSGATGGSGTYQYSINGDVNAQYQASPNFSGASLGSHSLWVRNSTNPRCPVNVGTITIAEPYSPIATPTASNNLPDLCNSNIATLTATGLAPGNGGSNSSNGSFSFNGSSQYLANNSTAAGLPTGSVATVEAWIKRNASQADAQYNGIVAWGLKGCTGTAMLFSIQSNGRLSMATWCNDFTPGTGPAVPADVWTHVAVVLNGTSVTFYINGNTAQTGTLSSTPAIQAAAGQWLTIGCTDNPGRYFGGTIDNVRIWSTARTQAEIQGDMYKETPTTGSVGANLRGLYHFNGGSLANAGSGGPALNVNNATAVRPDFYTYTWTGGLPSGSNPTPSTFEVQTSGPLTGTSPFQVTATANGCSSAQSNVAASNDFGGSYTVTLETAGTGNAANVVLPGNSGGTAYGRAAAPGYAETGLITATGGGAWARCVNWGLPVISTASQGPRIGFGTSPTTTMNYLTAGQPGSTTNLSAGIVCYTATLAVPNNTICANITCSSYYTGNVTVRVTLTLVNASNVAIPLDYTSSGHIVMRAAQNFKIRSRVDVLVPASGIQYYSCGSSSTPNTWVAILDWYDCCYKNPSATGFTYSFNYNSFPRFNFTTGPSAGTDFSVCVGGQPASRIDLEGSLGSLSSTCGALLHYWDGPNYTNAGTLLNPSGVQNPASFVTSTSPTTFGTYYYTVSQGPVASSNICYGTSSITITQNAPVVNGSIWTNGAPGTIYNGTPVPAHLDPANQVVGNNSWYDNRNWSHCVPDANTNSFINYNATNPANINSNVSGYWGANAATKFLKVDAPNNAKVIINAGGPAKLNVTD